MKEIVKIRLLPHAPTDQLKKAYKTDAGFDIMSAEDILIKPISLLKFKSESIIFSNGQKHKRIQYERQLIKTGIQLEAQDLMHFWIVPRSGFSTDFLFFIRNNPGLIDFEYRGELFISAFALGKSIPIVKGERIAQLVPIKQIDVEFIYVNELNKTERDAGGFGSSNNNIDKNGNHK